MAKSEVITLQDLKIEGLTDFKMEYLRELTINHRVGQFATAQLILLPDTLDKKTFTEDLTITIKFADKIVFYGVLANYSITLQNVTLNFADTSCLLNTVEKSCSFQNLSEKYSKILEETMKSSETKGKINLNAEDKAIESLKLRINETAWEFINRMSSELSAMIFTDLTAKTPLINVGLPAPKKTITVKEIKPIYNYDAMTFAKFKANPKKFAEGVKFINEDFCTLVLTINDWLNLGDCVKIDDKEYFVKSLNGYFVETIFMTTYELVSKNAFAVPIIKPINLVGRVLRAQVKKVEKDKIQCHLIDIDEKFDSNSTTWFTFATPYSSSDGSGWYVMPEVDDYVRILIADEDLKNAFALSSINTAPLKDPKNKSFKAPGGREILLTDKGVEIIADHQKTFIMLDKSGGISIVSSKNIEVHADGNINFDAKGKIQIVSQKEIAIQSGQSHVKLLSNQIAMGGGNIIVGE